MIASRILLNAMANFFRTDPKTESNFRGIGTPLFKEDSSIIVYMFQIAFVIKTHLELSHYQLMMLM